MTIPSPFSSIPDLVTALQRGEPIILLDDEERENEGDFVALADRLTPDAMMFLIRHGCGSVWLTLDPASIDRLGLEPLASRNDSPFQTAFYTSFEAREGTTTGISVPERLHTIATALKPTSTHADILTPGHVFPLAAREGGVLVRQGHTEAAVDLARLAGCPTPSAIITEIMNEDGSMARLPDLQIIAKGHGLLMGTIADLVVAMQEPCSIQARSSSRQTTPESSSPAQR